MLFYSRFRSERERKRKRKREREKEREERKREKREREKERERHTHYNRGRPAVRHTQRETERQKERERETETCQGRAERTTQSAPLPKNCFLLLLLWIKNFKRLFRKDDKTKWLTTDMDLIGPYLCSFISLYWKFRTKYQQTNCLVINARSI